MSCIEPKGNARCGHCGSMSVTAAIVALRTPGTRYSGCDWKYGWPHKFYIEHPGTSGKFYARHLALVDPAVVAEFATLARNLLGIVYYVSGEGVVYYRAPKGYQTWGTVGAAAGEVRDFDVPVFGPAVPEWILNEPLEGRPDDVHNRLPE